MSIRAHRLKTWPDYFRAIRAGEKTFEVRWNDRDFKPDDLLELAEFDPVKGEFTGETEIRRVTFVMADDRFGVMPGYVAMGMERLPPDIVVSEAALTLTRDQLKAWHAEHARQAHLRADGYKRAAEQDARLPNSAVAVSRKRACETAARLEAGFHAQATLIIGGASDA